MPRLLSSTLGKDIDAIVKITVFIYYIIWKKESYMSEQEMKLFFKFMIDNGNNAFTDMEKELLKMAINQSQNWQELLAVAVIANKIGQR